MTTWSSATGSPSAIRISVTTPEAGALIGNFHLHGLDDHQRVALGHGLADGHFHLPDAAGDFGSNFMHDGSKKLSIMRLLTIFRRLELRKTRRDRRKMSENPAGPPRKLSN
jgi:hypothetical protein